MKMTFVLSNWTTVPVGAYKIVYDYADRLAERGHIVYLLHPLDLTNAFGWPRRYYYKFKKTIGTLIRRKWFTLQPGVKFIVVPTLEEKYIPNADKIIATDWVPAKWIDGYGPTKGEKKYFIQVWLEDMPEVDKAWKLNLTKIVCSRWLQAKAEEFGEKAIVVPNAVDTHFFRIINSIEQRNPFSLGMLYHPAPFKGFNNGLNAIRIVKEKHSKVSLKLFGVFPKPKNMPGWVEYTRNPSREDLLGLYNSTGIFVNSSLTESWGLSPAEAMACGCAVAATNNRGILEYAEHGKTALISPVQSPAQLAAHILFLIENDQKRMEMARAGSLAIRQYTWDDAVDRFERALNVTSAMNTSGGKV